MGCEAGFYWSYIFINIKISILNVSLLKPIAKCSVNDYVVLNTLFYLEITLITNSFEEVVK